MTPNYEEVRNLIERRFRRRLLFGLHFVAFMAAVLVTAWWISTHYVYPGDYGNLVYLGGWGAIFVIHWLYYLLANARDREIQSVWTRVYGDAALTADRPKHVLEEDQDFMHLSSDAEWINGLEDAEKPKRRGG